MSGYANRFVRKEYADLGDDVFVEVRNPKTQPRAVLSFDRNITPTPGLTADDLATFEVISKIVKDWHVYDATSDEDEQPLLPLPATPETVAKLPVQIISDLSKLVMEALNPR